MIPILFNGTETAFTSNGLGRIPCTSCVVREERNGIYECTFTVPVTEDIYPQITEGKIIYCIHDDIKDAQPFDIYAKSAPMDGLVTFRAHHVSYRLNKISVKPFTASSCSGAIAAILTNSINTNPFTFWTDKNVIASFKNVIPTTARALLAGSKGSLLDVYGKGEYQWDKWNVKLYANRGNDNGVTIRYGKNLTDIKQDTDASQTYNAVAPYWVSGENGTVVTLTAGMVVNASQVVDNQVKCIPLDLSSEFDTEPTQQQLSDAATAWLSASDAWVMKDNLVIDFVSLWQSPEYENYAGLERVALCDKVSVVHPLLGVAANKIQVISVEYDVLRERYTRMELGQPKATYAEVIKAEAVQTVLSQVPSTDVMEQAIAYASDMITGAMGGCVIVNRDANGKPFELLILDTDDIDTAVNVWRWNTGGLGHSHNGYGGPYSDIALTADGQINANMITTGVLRAIEIINGNGTFHLESDGSITTSAIHITGGSIQITTNADNNDIIELSYSYSDDNHVTAKMAPLEFKLTHDWVDIDTQADRNFTSLQQAAGMFYYLDGVNRAQYGGQSLWFKDGNAVDRTRLIGIDGLYFYNSSGSEVAKYGTHMHIKDSNGITRSYVGAGFGVYYDSSGNVRNTADSDGTTLKNASGVIKAEHKYTGSYFHDEDGVTRLAINPLAIYGYDADSVQRMYISPTSYALYDVNAVKRFQIESQQISMWDASGQIRFVDTPSGKMYYDSNGKYRAYYAYDSFLLKDSAEKTRIYASSANGDIRVNDSTGTVRAIYGTSGFNIKDSSGTTRLFTDGTNYLYKIKDANDTLRATYADKEIWYYNTSGVLTAHYGSGKVQYYDSNGTDVIGEYAPQYLKLSVSANDAIPIHLSRTFNGLVIGDANNPKARVVASGFDIRNASDYGVMIDGTGYSNGTWSWKQINANDGYTYMIPAQQVGDATRVNGWQGVNLLRNTADFKDAVMNTNCVLNGYVDYAKSVTAPAYTGTLAWRTIAAVKPNIPYNRVKNVKVTLSFWYRSPAWYLATGGHDYPVVSIDIVSSATSSTRTLYHAFYEGATPTTSWQRWVKTFTITDDMFDSGSGTISDSSYLQIQVIQHNLAELQIMKVQLEAGDTAHVYQPNTLDIEDKLDNLFAGSITGVISTAHGGTGASTVAEATKNLGITDSQMSAGLSATLTMKGNVAMVFAKRDTTYIIALVDYWTAGAITIASSGGTDVPTITHSANSKDVVVTNNRSSLAIAATLIGVGTYENVSS